MAVKHLTTKELMKAYFEGGNAQNIKSGIELKEMLKAIQEIAEEGEGKDNPTPQHHRPIKSAY